jgi:hypothetical protein
MKIIAAWAGVIAGWQITHWAALAALIYTVLQIIVLVRDKFLRDNGPK